MSTKKQTSSKQSYSALTPATQNVMNDIYSAYQPLIGQGMNAYQGLRVAPLTQIQQQIQGGLGSFANLFNAQNEIPMLGDIQKSLTGILQGTSLPQQQNEQQALNLFNQTRAAPQYSDFNEFYLPMLTDQYSGPGLFSSGRPQTASTEATRLQRDIENERAQFLNTIEQRNQDIALQNAALQAQTAPIAGSLASLPEQIGAQRLAGQTGMYQLAAQQQAQQQAEINAQMQKFWEENQITDPQVMEVLLNVMGIPQGTSVGWTGGRGWTPESQLALGILGSPTGQYSTVGGDIGSSFLNLFR